jgi:hypothetical protein
LPKLGASKPNAAPPRPRILLCRYHKPRGGVENLSFHTISIDRLDGKCERQIDFPLFERAIVPPGRHAADDARVFSGELLVCQLHYRRQ